MNLRAHWTGLWVTKDRRPIWEWVRDNIKELPIVFSRREFDIHGSRHFIGPLEALDDDYVRQVVIRKPVRGGGSMIGDLWQVRQRAVDPGPAMDVFQSDAVAEDHCRNRPVRMMQSVKSLEALMPDARKITNSQITFLDGLPYYITGPGINNLQTKGIRYMRLDEPVLYKAGIIAEAEARLGDFAKLQTSKFLLISQAGDEDDEFERRFNSGDCSTWNIACAGCGTYFRPRWSLQRADGTPAGMRWDSHKDERGFWLVEKCLNSIRYECPTCGHAHSDSAMTRMEWNRTGRYEAMNPSASRTLRSYHWNAIIDSPWQALVEEFLNAVNAYKMGSPEQLIVFFTKKMAEPRSLRTLGLGSVEFVRKPLQIDAATEHMRVGTIDRQEDHYWMLVCSWSKTGECRRVWFGKLFSRGDLKVKADEWHCHNVICDGAYEAKGIHGVYATCALYNQPGKQAWFAAKGSPEQSFRRHINSSQIVESSFSDPLPADPEQGTAGMGRNAAILYHVSSDRLADQLQNLINKGRFIEPAGVDETDPNEVAWRAQINSEYKRKTADPKTGKLRFQWVKARQDNHGWDCAKLQVLAAIMGGIVPDLE